MQMKWDQIWFLAHYKTIWTIPTPKKFIFCQHVGVKIRTKKKWWLVQYNRNCLFFKSFMLPCASSSCAAAGDLIVCKSNCTGSIWRVSLLCGCACVLSEWQLDHKNSHIGHSWRVSLLCVCACVVSDVETEHRNKHIDHTQKAFLLYESACDFPASDHEWKNSHIEHTCVFFCGSFCVSLGCQLVCRKSCIVYI